MSEKSNYHPGYDPCTHALAIWHEQAGMPGRVIIAEIFAPCASGQTPPQYAEHKSDGYDHTGRPMSEYGSGSRPLFDI